MAPERNERSGRYTASASDDDALEAIHTYIDESGEPIVTSGDVADALDVSLSTARRRLSALEDEGEIEQREVGRTVVWWPSARTDTDTSKVGV